MIIACAAGAAYAADHVEVVTVDAADALYRNSLGQARAGQTAAALVQVCIGIDTGAVVAGVIGKREFLYDLWGDAVNTASRMESHGVAGRIQVTNSTRQRLSEPFMLGKRGAVNVKSKGEMHTWFLNSRMAGVALIKSLFCALTHRAFLDGEV